MMQDTVFAVGDRAVFRYSFPLDPSSEIGSRLHQRSGEVVTVVGALETDGADDWTPEERGEAGMPGVYAVRFADGATDSAFEDELSAVAQ